MLKTAYRTISATLLFAAASLMVSGVVLACPRVLNSGADVATLGLSVLLLPLALRLASAHHQLAPAH